MGKSGGGAGFHTANLGMGRSGGGAGFHTFNLGMGRSGGGAGFHTDNFGFKLVPWVAKTFIDKTMAKATPITIRTLNTLRIPNLLRI